MKTRHGFDALYYIHVTLAAEGTVDWAAVEAKGGTTIRNAPVALIYYLYSQQTLARGMKG